MEELDERKKELLRMIVRTYVKSVNPVGSLAIARHYRNELSPATIRNEMHDLEEHDFLAQPHTSAGRVPTDKGYRYYVNHLMPEAKVSGRWADYVEREYRKRLDDMDALIERTSKILSSLSGQAGFVIFPSLGELTLKRIDLTSLGRHQLLVVWVTENGFSQSRVLDMKEDIPEGELARTARFLNQELEGMLLSEIRPYLTQKLADARDSLRGLYLAARTIVFESFPKNRERQLSLDGSRRVLEQPEFQSWEKSRRLFRQLEDPQALLLMVREDLESTGVQVHIGSEHRLEGIDDCSLVTARYQVNGRTLGGLGILGPRRMPYDRVVSLVDYVSSRFGEALEKWL